MPVSMGSLLSVQARAKLERPIRGHYTKVCHAGDNRDFEGLVRGTYIQHVCSHACHEAYDYVAIGSLHCRGDAPPAVICLG